MSAYGPLPHIIGSEEYIHDNSCGLAGISIIQLFFFGNNFILCEYTHVSFSILFQIDDMQPLSDDFSWLREFQSESSDSRTADISESQIFGAQRGYEKVQCIYSLRQE